MKESLITVDVYASWSGIPPVYRIYVDNDLLTERDFIWPGNENFVRENIVVSLEPGNHEVKIVQVSTHGSIQTKHVSVNGVTSATNFII